MVELISCNDTIMYWYMKKIGIIQSVKFFQICNVLSVQSLNQCVTVWSGASNLIYCVPAGRGLRKTAMAPGRDETRAVHPLGRTQVVLTKAYTD